MKNTPRKLHMFYEKHSDRRFSIMEGLHEQDIGEIGVAYSKEVAALIAAAPDLLEALEELTVWLERHGAMGGEVPAPEDIAKARAALLKARGE